MKVLAAASILLLTLACSSRQLRGSTPPAGVVLEVIALTYDNGETTASLSLSNHSQRVVSYYGGVGTRLPSPIVGIQRRQGVRWVAIRTFWVDCGTGLGRVEVLPGEVATFQTAFKPGAGTRHVRFLIRSGEGDWMVRSSRVTLPGAPNAGEEAARLPTHPENEL